MALRGRPPIGRERKAQVTVRIDPDVLAAVRDLGGDNFSQTVEAALQVWLAQQPRPKRKQRRKATA
jgi:uncharacterized protein (DUF4415 family)